MLVTANTAVLKDRERLCLLRCLPVCHDEQYHNFEKTGIIPGPYLILMYTVKEFLQAISEELHQMDGRMDILMHKTYSKVLLLQRGTNM